MTLYWKEGPKRAMGRRGKGGGMGANETIKEVFCNLLQEKPYDEITIAEICRITHVSSKTFYKHYEGKPGLVREIMYDDWVRPVLQVREVLPLDAIYSATHLMIEQSFERIWERRSLYCNLFKHYGRDLLADDIVAVLEPLCHSVYERYHFPTEENEFVVRLFSSLQVLIIYWWLTEHDDITPKAIARYFNDWCFGRWRDLEN